MLEGAPQDLGVGRHRLSSQADRFAVDRADERRHAPCTMSSMAGASSPAVSASLEPRSSARINAYRYSAMPFAALSGLAASSPTRCGAGATRSRWRCGAGATQGRLEVRRGRDSESPEAPPR